MTTRRMAGILAKTIRERHLPVHYHEDPTAVGEKRTIQQLGVIRKQILGDALCDMGLQVLLLAAIVTAAAFIAGSIEPVSSAIVCAVILAALAFKVRARYRNEKLMVDETLGVVRGDIKGISKIPAFVNSLCDAAGVPKPAAIEYVGWQYTGEYDPNLAIVTLGTPLRSYETDAALMTAAHETAHHIVLNSPDTSRKEAFLLRCSTMCDTVGVCFVFLFFLSCLFGFAAQDASFYLSMFLVAQLLKYGVLATHENNANATLRSLYETHPAAFEAIFDIPAAFKTLDLGLGTYYAELALWVVMGLVFSFASFSASLT